MTDFRSEKPRNYEMHHEQNLRVPAFEMFSNRLKLDSDEESDGENFIK